MVNQNIKEIEKLKRANKTEENWTITTKRGGVKWKKEKSELLVWNIQLRQSSYNLY